jgi:hypothetical protein
MRFRITLLVLLATSACGYRVSVEKNEKSFDGVKLLVAGQDTPYDKAHYNQDHYDLGPGRRLLLRFEALANHSVTIAGDHQVIVQVGLEHSEDSELATSSLLLCPLSTDWMMLATWTRAHPFSDSGSWNRPGGDFDPQSCITRSNKTQKENGDFAAEVQFDATRWYTDYPRGRNQNFGFALIAKEPISILGETSGSLSPRILFDVAQTWVDWRLPSKE